MHCVCVHMCFYVYIALYNFIIYVALHNHHHNQDNQLQHCKTPSGYLRLLWYRPTHPLFPQFPTTVNHKYVHHLCNCATSQIIHRWSHKVFILLKSAFSLSRIFLRSIQVIVCMNNLFLFITESYPMIWIY